jgi:hypothetical protein
VTTQQQIDWIVSERIADLKHQTDYARRLATDVCTQAACDRYNAALTAFQNILRTVNTDESREHSDPTVKAILYALVDR